MGLCDDGNDPVAVAQTGSPGARVDGADQDIAALVVSGRRTYFACNDLYVTARQIITGYRLRWAIELYHKQTKQYLGFEDVATSGFPSVMSHVHWMYCAYILLQMSPPGVSADVKSLGGKQRQLQRVLANKEKRRVLQKLTQIGGVQRYKDELRQALAEA